MDTSTAPVTFRLSKTEIADLDRMAKFTARSRSALIAKAVRRYIDEELDFLLAVQEGLADARAGNTVSHDVILADSAERRRLARLKAA